MPITTWQGLRDDISVVSEEGMLTAQNVSFRISGEARRRPGLGTRVDESGVLSTDFQDRINNTYLVFSGSAGTLRSVAVSDATETALKTALSTAYRGSFAKSNSRLYFTNDFDPMQVIERGDVACNEAGIAAPTSGTGIHTMGTPTTATGLTQSGTHLLRYRYYNSKSLYVSNPSNYVSVTLTGSSTLTISIGVQTGGLNVIRSTDPKVDQVIIEMTPVDDSTYYRAALVNQTLTGTTVSMLDATLIQQEASSFAGDYGHEQPPLHSMIIEHRGRLFGWGATVRTITGVTVTNASTTVTNTGSAFSRKWGGRLLQLSTGTTTYRIVSVATGGDSLVISESWTGSTATGATLSVVSAAPDTMSWSRAGFPESWKPSDWARRVLQNQTDVPSGMISTHGGILLSGQRTMRLFDYDADPALARIEQIPTEMGCWNIRCLISCAGKVYGWGRSGVWVIDGLLPIHLSRPVDATIEADYDADQSEEFHGWYDPRERVLWWIYVATGDTAPKSAFFYDLDRQQWGTRTFRQAILASTLVAGSTNNVRALLSDENGYSWYLTADRFDGVPTTLVDTGSEYTGVVTVSTTGATATVIPTTEALPTGATDLVGVVLYHPTTSGTALVSSNGANSITLAGTGLASAPTISTELYLGSFEWTMRTKWFDGRGLDTKKRPAYVSVKKVPGTSAGKVKIRIYEDFSTSPMAFSLGSGDSFPDGVTWTDGATFATVDLDGGSGDGVAYVPLSANWKRAISVEATSVKPANALKMLQFNLISESQRSEVATEGE